MANTPTCLPTSGPTAWRC